MIISTIRIQRDNFSILYHFILAFVFTGQIFSVINTN
jgi:hypothetical protein